MRAAPPLTHYGQDRLPATRPPSGPNASHDRASRPAPLVGWPDAPQASFEAIGWRIGADHARLGLTPPPEHLHPGNPVADGWRATQPGVRPQRAPVHAAVLQWLGLRLDCWRRGRVFDGLSVTPRGLMRLDTGHCPVLRQPFGPAAGAATPMVLFAGAACAAGNLALVSRAAAQSAAGMTLAQATRNAEQAEASGGVEGLAPQAWRRLASLIAMATPLSHDEAAARVLRLTPPPRCRVVNPAHALQVLLTAAVAGRASGPDAGVEPFVALLPPASRRAFFQLASALLAHRLGACSQGGGAPGVRIRHALEDAWGDARVVHRWGQLMSGLDAERCTGIVRALAVRRTRASAGPRWRWLDEEAAFDGWALERGGRLPLQAALATSQRLKS